MKKKRLTILLTVLTFVFSACSNADDYTPDAFPAKKLVKLEQHVGWGKRLTWLFKYDGYRLQSVGRPYGYPLDDALYQDYAYSGNKITLTEIEKGNNFEATIRYTYTLDKYKRIIQWHYFYANSLGGNSDETRDYFYSKEGYLERVVSTAPNEDAELRYDFGNLVAVDYGKTTIAVQYTDIPDKLGINLIPSEYGLELQYADQFATIFGSQVFYQLGYYGKKSKYLISEVGAFKYSYELDDDGYVTVMTAESVEGETIAYKFFYDK